MAMQFSTLARNNWLDDVEDTIGTDPTLEFRVGSVPSNCAAPDSGGTPLAIITCPTNWLADASGGTKVLAGTWTVTASNTGTAGHFRLKSSGGTCHIQGTVTATGGGGDLQLSSASLVATQDVRITAFTLTAGGP